MVGRVLPFLAYGWISQVAINNRGNKAYVLIQKQSHLFYTALYVLIKCTLNTILTLMALL